MGSTLLINHHREASPRASQHPGVFDRFDQAAATEQDGRPTEEIKESDGNDCEGFRSESKSPPAV